jgi:hypothetical protein
MLRVYFDNNVASAISKRDINQVQMTAIDAILQMRNSGRIGIGTSNQTPREMEQAPAQYQGSLKSGIADLDHANVDHRLVGFQCQGDQIGGYVCYPLISDVVDDTLYARLLAIGLKPNDAKHLMYAVKSDYDRFLTMDSDFTARRPALQSICPSIRICTPSELVTELGL